MDPKARLLKTSLITSESRPKNKFKKDISAQIFEREFMAERDKTKFNPVESDLPVPKFTTRAKYGLHKTTIGSNYMREASQEMMPEFLRAKLQQQTTPPLPEPNGKEEPTSKEEDPTPLK